MVVEVVRYCIVHTMLVRYSWRIHEQSVLQREGIGEEWEREREASWTCSQRHRMIDRLEA